jgi:hypothetical protein
MTQINPCVRSDFATKSKLAVDTNTARALAISHKKCQKKSLLSYLEQHQTVDINPKIFVIVTQMFKKVTANFDVLILERCFLTSINCYL